MKTARLALLLAALSTLAGAAEPPQTITLVNTPEPTTYRMENNWPGGALLIGVPWLLNKGRNSNLSGDLSAAMRHNTPNKLLRERLAEALTEAGFAITPDTSGVTRPNQTDLDYRAIDYGGQPFIHAYVERLGLESRGTSRAYQPMADIYFCLVVPAQSATDCTYYDRGYVGNGYTEAAYMEFPARPQDRWTDYDDAFKHLDAVQAALEEGIGRAAKGIAKVVTQCLREKCPE